MVCLKKERRIKAEFQSIEDSAGLIVTLPTWKQVLRCSLSLLHGGQWAVGNMRAETESSESLSLL